jgi:hypothetical protein
MKAIALALAILCLAIPAFGRDDHRSRVDVDIDIDVSGGSDFAPRVVAPFLRALSEVNVNIVGVVGKDFIEPPTVDQAFSALREGMSLGGVGWEVVIRRFGLGGTYLVHFEPDASDSWWLDWEVQPIFASYHVLGGGAKIDPFVDAGLGCAGRVFLGPYAPGGDRLGISLYPFASAGLALNLDTFRVGAKLSFMPWQGRIPATSIAGYEVGECQLQILAGVNLGSHR